MTRTLRNRLSLMMTAGMAVMLAATTTHAALVRNEPVTLKQPDGTLLKALVSGDEFFHRYHDANGFTIIQDPISGKYVYAVKAGEDIEPSPYVAGKDDPTAAGLTPDALPSPSAISKSKKATQSLSAFSTSAKLTGTYLGCPTTGTVNNVVIYLCFQDESFSHPRADFEPKFVDSTAGANSMLNYYKEASYNQLTLNSFFYPTGGGTSVNPVVDSHNRGYYMPYNAVTNTEGYTTGDQLNQRATQLFQDAVNAIASQVPTSLNIDQNNDGYVDNIIFVLSGAAGANALFWGYTVGYGGPAVYINGKAMYITNRNVEDQIMDMGPGVICHEMFHSLGAPDLYHNPATTFAPVGEWDLMEGNTFAPQHVLTFMKFRYGKWIASVPTATTGNTYTLNPTTSSTGNCFKIASPNSSSQYYMVEYRRKTGTFEGSVPDSGLLVYRINTASDGRGNIGYPTYADEVYVYRPGGTASGANGNLNTATLHSEVGRTLMDDYSDPNGFLANGNLGGLAISQVGACGNTISFTLKVQCHNPVLNPAGGYLTTASPKVTPTCDTPSAVLHYTTNGADPTESSPSVASGTAITLPGSCTLKVRAYRTGWTPSDIISGVYTVSDRMYVNRNVSGFVHDGLSWQTAFIDVGDATGVAVSGHTIWVAAGTYYDDGGLTLPSGVALFGGFKGTETTLSQRNWVKNTTILDGMGDWTVVRIPSSASSGTRIDGFTIQNGYEKYSGGGGIDMGYGGQTVIAFNIIRFNSSWRGGAIYAGDMNAASIYNNVIYGNTATDGAAIYCSGEFYMKLVGNTIVSNTASGNGGGLAMEDTYAGKGEIKNNLIASNSSGIYRSLSMATLPPISYNCLYGNASYAYSGLPIQTGLNGNITAYPSFVNSGLNDYHLAFGSGCIDMGTGFNLPNFYDADGGTRGGDGNQDGIGGVDIGAYEFRRVYVDKDSASPSDGTTWARAFHTIQAGIDAACYGDEVWVAAGTYFEHPSIKDGAKLYGGFAGTENSLALRYWWQNDTIIDGSSAVGSAVTIQAGTGWLTRLDGFTVRNGNATIGGGIWCGNGSAAVIVNNKIGPNSAANYGGGIYCDTSSNIIANNLIVANTASLTGGALYLKDCSAPISYNTIVGNTGTGGGGGIGYTGGFPIISSNIIAFNNHGVYGTVGYPAFKYNNVYGNTSGNFYAGMTDPTGIDGNISADPLFGEVPSEYLEYGDYHLTGLSPCIDTAWNLYRPSSDLDGRSRPLYSAGDMGAYEYRRIYVDATSNAGFYDGSTWATAYHTITDGLNAARPGDEIWVAVNVYSERITLKDGVGLYGGFAGTETARSERNWSANITTIDAATLGRAVTIPDQSHASTRIDGFTIKNGKTTLVGGGIYVGQQSRARIENNRIVGNISQGASSGSGGGIYCNTASPTIINNVIYGNAATRTGPTGTVRGGGVYCYGGTPILINNTIASNIAKVLSVSGEGGGVYLDSTGAVLRNNIIAFNSSGITKSSSGAPTLAHNCVYGNTTGNYQNIWTGFGDISQDPLFVDTSVSDVHLRSGSPCIDQGDSLGAPSLDRDGMVRPIDGDCDGVALHDIGAYESPSDLFSAKKSLPDGSSVVLSGLSATACFAGETSFRLYAEKPNRSSGIRVDYSGHAISEGQIVSISGVMATDAVSHERYVSALNGWVKATGSTNLLTPLVMRNSSVGGSASGLQIGVDNGAGLNNIGLLVRVFGKVVSTSTGTIFIDDGCGLSEWLGFRGMRIDTSALPAGGIQPNQYVEVTGISTIVNVARFGLKRCVRVRSASDLVISSTPVVLLHGADVATAQSFKTLLDGEGLSTDLVSMSSAGSTNFSKYSLIVVGYDTHTGADWGTPAIISNIVNSSRPVIGIETGGAIFFGKQSLNMGTPKIAYATGNQVVAKDTLSAIFHQPYAIAGGPQGIITVSSNASGWYGYSNMATIPGTVTALGNVYSYPSRIMLAFENSRYFYWPFRDKPDLYTTDGKHLLVNAAWYSMR